MSETKRHVWIPDTQVKPGAPQDHFPWIAAYIVEMKPDVIGHIGDHWDFPSLSRHETPGSVPLEGARYADDLLAGNAAFKTLNDPIEAERARLKRNKGKQWNPRKIFCKGNHEIRADRVARADAKLVGTIGSDQCDTQDWEVHGFLDRVWIDDILFTHYLQNVNSSRPIGGGIENRLTRVGRSFLSGHEQGLQYGSRVLASGLTIRGTVAGSCYLHREEYRGAQGQDHWRGIVVLNEVRGDGRYSFMDVTLDFLCRKYEGVSLHKYMTKKYPNGEWSYLA